VRCGSQQLGVIVHLCLDHALHVMSLSRQGQELQQISQLKIAIDRLLNMNRRLVKQHPGTAGAAGLCAMPQL